MANALPYFVDEREEVCLHKLKTSWGALVGLGIVLIVVGSAAISRPGVASLATIKFLGFMLLFAAGAQIASAIWARQWGGFGAHLLMGIIYAFLGLVLLDRPGESAKGYTLLLAVFFVAEGLIRVVFSLTQRFSGWGWSALSGVITLFLGVLVWRDYPESAIWVIGTFVGIDLLFLGWSWVMLGLAIRTAPVPVSAKV